MILPFVHLDHHRWTSVRENRYNAEKEILPL